MNILLIVTLSGDLVRSTEHIGIGYLAACLREQNHIVEILEIEEKDIEKEEYISALEDKEFVNITTTSVTMKCLNMKNIHRLSQIIKKHRSNLYIACDGYMATFRGQEILEKYSEIDFTIQGESEVTFCELINSLENEKSDLSLFP